MKLLHAVKRGSIRKGFTLIELLVVIAIIGILSAVVLSSLNTARNKGNDARVQKQLGQFRNTAALYLSANGTYGSAYGSGATSGTCPTTGGAQNSGSLLHDMTTGTYQIIKDFPTISGVTVTACRVDATSFAVAVNLPSAGTGAYWCVDSNGSSKRVNGTLTNTTLTASLCP